MDTRRPRIAVVGSSNIDFVMRMSRLPRIGETVTDATFLQAFGGKGANQAVAAARAGGDVWFVNCVGDDAMTPRMLESLAGDGIHMDYVFRETGCPSGTALVMIGEDGANYLSVAPGANYRLGTGHIDAAVPLFHEAALALFQCEVLPQTLIHALHAARRARCRTLLNYAPARPLPAEALRQVGILVVNETEAEYLSGVAVATGAEAARAGERLVRLGPDTVVVTLGARGAWVTSAGLERLVPAFPVRVVDTTAAGDTFCGALAVALGEGRELEDSLRFAAAAAALCVTRLGAQPSIPRRGDIDALLGGGSR